MATGVQVASLYAKLGVDMGSAMRDLKNFRGELDGASGGMGKLQKAMGTGLKVAAAGAATAIGALVAGIGAATKQAASMEQAIADIRAAMGLTAEQTEELKGLITDLGLDPKLKVSAVEAASAIEMLGKNGLTMNEIMQGAARNTVLLANSTGAEFATAADIATDVMQQFNIDAAQMEKAVNGITGVTQASKFGIDDYRLAIAQAGGVAGSVGLEFEDFNALITATSSSFASGSDAGTSLKVTLQRLVPQTEKAEDMMIALGLASKETGSAFFDANGQMKSAEEIAGLLQNAFKGLSDARKIEAASIIFGTDAMRTALALAEGGRETILKMKEAIGNTSAEDAAAVRMDTLAGAWEIFQGIVETLTISIGDKFLPIARRLVEWTSELASTYGPPVIEWAGRLADEITALMDNTSGLLSPLQGMIDKLGAAINVTKTFAASVLETLMPFTSAITKATSWQDVLGAAAIVISSIVLPALGSILVAAAPVIAQFAALTLAVAALRTAWQTDFWGIRTTTQKVLQDLSDWFFKESGIWRGTWEDTLEFLKWWGQFGWRDAFYNPIIKWLLSTKSEIVHWKNNTILSIKDWINEAKFKFDQWVADVKGKFEHWSSVVERAVEVWAGRTKTKFTVWKNETLAVVREWADDIRDRIDSWLERFGISDWLQRGRDLIGGLWNGFREKWYDFTSWTSQVWSDWVNRFRNFFGIHSPSTLFNDFGQNMMEGLAGGIGAGADMVAEMMDALSRSVQGEATRVLDEVNSLVDGVEFKWNSLMPKLKPLFPNASGLLDAPAPFTGTPSELIFLPGKDPMTQEEIKAIRERIHGIGLGNFQFSTALGKVASDLPGLQAAPEQIVNWIAKFANSVQQTLAKAGVGVVRPDGSMIPLSTNTRNAIQNLSNTNLTSQNNTEMVVQAVMTLVQELRNRNLGNKFDIQLAPQGSTTNEGLFSLVQYLQALYA